jgi:hypothetical protein
MADFRTHLMGGILAGTALALGAAGLGLVGWARIPLIALAGIVGGIAPDIDSDSGRPQGILFGAATLVLPTAIVWRIDVLSEQEPWWGVACWVALALLVWYPLRWAFRAYTVHRGMFHSTPAIFIFAALCFLVNGRRIEHVGLQLAMGLAGGLGYLVHLVLDELWAVDFEGRRIRVKKSLGTALKLVGPVRWHNAAAWGAVVLLGLLVWRGMYGQSLEDLLGRVGLFPN